METKSDFQDNRYATDSGPKCKDCEETLWVYWVEPTSKSLGLSSNATIIAMCACCHRTEYMTLFKQRLPCHIQDIKRIHFMGPFSEEL